MDSTITINLIMVAILIAMTAFFVGSEFAVVKVRISRIDQLIAEGNKKAIMAKKVAQNLDYYLSACQLGITVTALALGWLGEPTVERILHPVFTNLGVPESFSTVISFVVAFGLVTFLHVTVGELAPKTLAIQYAEKMTLLFARPLYIFGMIMFPLIWILNGSSRMLLRLFGVKPTEHEQAHSEEELKIIMTKSYESGEINQTELEYMENIFAFDERVAKDIMVPRTQMITLDQSMNREEVIATLSENQFTRYPVTKDGDKDEIIGFINVKMMFTNMVAGRESHVWSSIHSLPFIQENTSLQDALLKMRKERVHIALVLDEYGGTAGILTMEDILEEIVGDIRDEFDMDEVPDIQQKDDDTHHINGRVLLSELEKQFGLTFKESEEVDTIGGWILMQNMNISVHDEIEFDDHCFTILEMENHQIKQISLTCKAKQEQELGLLAEG